jgi:hypothetical protein
MPVLTKTKKTVRPVSQTDTEEEAESKAEPIVITKALAKLMSEWNQSALKTDSYFPRVVQFVIENDTTKDEIKKALIELRGMTKLTAGNEISVIWRVREFPDEVQACIDGEDNPETGETWKVRELRKLGKTDQDAGGRTVEDTFKRKLGNLAKYAVEDAKLERPDFLQECKEAWNDAYAKATSKNKSAKEDEATEEGEEGEEEGG